jgi:hypothetical protein
MISLQFENNEITTKSKDCIFTNRDKRNNTKLTKITLTCSLAKLKCESIHDNYDKRNKKNEKEWNNAVEWAIYMNE